MTNFASWIAPEVMRVLGWTLLHFLWQGAGLAALFAVAMTVSRSAAARYGIAVATLVLMMASPVTSFMWMRGQTNPAVGHETQDAHSLLVTPEKNAIVAARSSAPFASSDSEGSSAVVWLVEAWFLGVLLLSLRTAGGLLLISRMRRKETESVGRDLYERCLALERRMGLDRVIRYCECSRLDAPAVLGWFRPVVLLPLRALSGLTEVQIEAVIAHELAHIRRLDGFVNLFQMAVETLLFYHPAVWWVSQRIRTERENCCDDEAIAVCGDRLNYARALTMMEEWRTAPSMMMAANRGPLAERVLRLLGVRGASGHMRMAGLGIGVVCLMSALLAGHAFLAVAHARLGAGSPAQQEQTSGRVIVVRPADATELAKRSGGTAQASKDKEKDKGKPKDQQNASGAADKKESYIDAMEAAGFKNLTVDELIGMKIQGVTPAYVKEIHDLGLQPTADELVGMKVQGITPDYIREMRSIASNLTVDELIGMKVQGVTPQYARDLRELGIPGGADDLVGMKVQGITPEYVREIQATGFKPNTEELIGMKVQGVTADYVRALQAQGFKNMECDEVIGAKVQGITPEFIEKARRHGFQNLTLDKLIALKHADIL